MKHKKIFPMREIENSEKFLTNFPTWLVFLYVTRTIYPQTPIPNFHEIFINPRNEDFSFLQVPQPSHIFTKQ